MTAYISQGLRKVHAPYYAPQCPMKCAALAQVLRSGDGPRGGAVGPDTLMNGCTALNSAHRSVLTPS